MKALWRALLISLALTMAPLTSAGAQSPSLWNGYDGINAVAIDPVTPSTVYAAVYEVGLFMSLDGGDTWDAIGRPSEWVSALVIDPRTPARLYAATQEGVSKSSDAGLTWSPTGLTSGPIHDLKVDPSTPAVLYALSADSLLKSSDEGATWSAVLSFSDYGGGWCGWYWSCYTLSRISALVIDPNNPVVLYASGFHEHWDEESGTVLWSHLLTSADGGLTWTLLFQGSAIRALAIEPRTNARSDTTLYLTDDYEGVLKSVDGGHTWGPTGLYGANQLITDPVVPSTVYAAGADVWKTVDGGATWSIGSAGLADTLTSYGSTWSYITPAETWFYIHPVSVNPVSTGTVYAGTPIGLFKSSDGGSTWTRTGLAQRSLLRSLELDPYQVQDGNEVTGTVSLAAPAPPGGVTVALRVAAYRTVSISAPENVTVPAGSMTGQFRVTTTPLYFDYWAYPSISATLDDGTRTAILQISGTPMTRIVSAVDENGRGVQNDALTTTKTITFAFTGATDVLVGRFECSFGWSSFSPCTSPVTYTGLKPRQEHYFQVRAVDTSGRVAQHAAAFVLRVGPPQARISPTRGPVGTRVELNGFGLDGVTTVHFNGIPAPIEAQARYWMSATVPTGATTGPLTLTWAGGNVSTTMMFTVADDVADWGPDITGVTPSIVLAGREMTVSGSFRSRPATVTIGGIPASVVSEQYNELRVQPLRSATGRVVVTTSPWGSAMSEADVVVLEVTSLSPAAGPVRSEVSVTGNNLQVITDVRFNGVSAAIREVSATTLTVVVPREAANGPVTVHWPGSSAWIGTFTVTPGIVAISPNPTFFGAPVTIAGTNLVSQTGKPTVRIGGALATVRPGATPDAIQINLPASVVTGRVTVTTVDGTATSATDVVVIRRPTVTSFTPAQGPVGTLVIVTGPNLNEVSSVHFGGVAAELALRSPTALHVIVPAGASTGPVTLSTQAGTVSSATRFTVTPPADLRVVAVTVAATAATTRPLTVATAVRNAGGSPVPSATLRLYVSADDRLDAGDQLLATRAVAAVAAGGSATTTTAIIVPADLAAGTYRIIAAVEAGGTAPESDTSNNTGVSGPVSVTLYRSNLAVTALTLPARGAAGQPISVANTVRNLGQAPVGAFTVRFHVSSDTVLDAGDPVIGTRGVASLAAGASSTTSTSLRLPVTIDVGSYYVIAVADALEQHTETDENNVAVAGPFTVIPPRPELGMSVLTVPARGTIGREYLVENAVRNTGLVPAGAFRLRFHLSRSTVLGAADPEIGVRAVGALAAGASSGTYTALQIPPTVAAGKYYVIVLVDDRVQQAELDETNNLTVSAPFMLATPGDDGGGGGVCRAPRILGWKRPPTCGGDGDE